MFSSLCPLRPRVAVTAFMNSRLNGRPRAGAAWSSCPGGPRDANLANNPAPWAAGFYGSERQGTGMTVARNAHPRLRLFCRAERHSAHEPPRDGSGVRRTPTPCLSAS